jgi:hypothetical protein
MGAIVLGVVYADKRRRNKIKELAEKSGFEYDFKPCPRKEVSF